jgi:uncharacterized membrane protein (UPF0127 family)
MRWLMLLVVLAGCAQADEAPQKLPGRQAEIGWQALEVQVADDDAEREKGLMFVKSMPENQGMLFVWKEAAPRSFWMHNTYIPLDIVYLNKGKVVSVIAWAKPFDETGLPSGQPADMVLEVNGGWVAAHKLKVGDTLTLK